MPYFTNRGITPLPVAPSYTGPGDIESGAIGWWGLRAYNAAKATANAAAVRLIRSSDSAQQDILLNTNGTLDTSVAFFNGSTYKVVTLYDQSGAGHDFTQATDANRPTFVLASIGSRPAIVTAGTDVGLGTTMSPAQTQPFHIAAVAQITTYTIAGFFGWETTGGNVGVSNSGGGTIRMSNPSAIDVSCTDTASPHSLQFVANSTSSVICIDGADGSPSDAGPRDIANNEAMRCAQPFNGGGSLTGKLGEVGLWPAAGSVRAAQSANALAYWV